jgi:RHS repeat-associated protein
MRPLRCLCNILFLLVLLPSVAAAQVSLTLGDTTLPAGDSGSVTASISSDGSAVALQFDVLYDPALVSLGTVTGGPALTGNHSIASNPIGPGRDRIVITTSPVTALGSGVLATINLGVDTGAAAGTTPLDWDGVVISDAAAQPITPSSLTPGTITITAAAAPVEPEAIPANPLWSLMLLTAMMFLLVRRLRSRAGVVAVAPLLALGLLAASTTAQAQNIPGDANGDGRIDIEDVRLIVERILERGLLPGDGDCNRDSTINVLDTVCSQLPFVPGETAPIILGPGDRTIPAGIAFTMNLFAADPDAGATQSWELLSGPAGLAVSSAGELTWTPGAGAAGPNTVSIRVTDDTARSDEATFTIRVTVLPATPAANAPPVLTVPDDQSLLVGTALAAQASATDPDVGDTLTFRLVNGPAGMSINPDTGALNWTPQADQARSADVVIQVEDAAGATDFGSFIATANALNGSPVAIGDIYVARKGETLTIPTPEGVLLNDEDPNGDPLSATRLTDPTKGTVDSFGTDGAFSYTPVDPPPITIGLVEKCRTEARVSAGTMSAADVDNDGVVELVNLVGGGRNGLFSSVFVIDGRDCSTESNASVPEYVGAALNANASTLVNLDDDPELEVVGQYFRFNDTEGNDERLYALNLDGTPLENWPAHGLSEANSYTTALNSGHAYSGPVAADLDGDGYPELITGLTNVNFNLTVQNTTRNLVVAYDGRTGAVLWEFLGDITRSIQRSATPTIVDLDLDGDTEIIWSHHVLDHEGNLLFDLPVEQTIPNGGSDFLTVAIANFDNDAFPEIIAYDASHLTLYSHDGQIQWQIERASGGFGFPWSDITVAELDGDPFPEFVSMLRPDGGGGLTLYAFDSDGQDLWDHGSQDLVTLTFAESRNSSPVAFDFDGDGIDELIQVRGQMTGANDPGLYIFDGRDGSIIDFQPLGPQNNQDETLTVADVDGDGFAEIITNDNTEFGSDTVQIWDNLPDNPFPAAPPFRSGTNYQTSWFGEDASLPTSLPPFWLEPGQNGWNMIQPPADPLNPERDSFTYRASDGASDSNTATVNIEIQPQGNPPSFISEPGRGTSRGVAYVYEPLVVDIDPGDVVSFELLAGPTGMTIDAQTGRLDWFPASAGDFPVSIIANDTMGFSAAQIFTIAVGDPVVVPDVVGATEATAETTLTNDNLARGDVFLRSHPTIAAGVVIAQSPTAGAAVDFGAPVDLVVSTGAGIFDRDDDGDGFSENEGDCDDGADTIYPGAPDANGDGVDQDCDGLDGNKTLVAIELTPDSKRVLTSAPTPIVAMGVFEDGTAQDITSLATWVNGPTFSSGTSGAFTAEATFRGITGAASFEVVDRVVEDLAPQARISSPTKGETVTAPVDVVVVATDNNLLRWEIDYRSAGEGDFVSLAEGTTSRSNQPSAEFDPTTLLNGLYEIRLRVYDRGGNVSEDATTVRVEGQLKVGNFSLRYVDLELPLNGIPISIARTYDSRDKRVGDFGVGWRLAVNSIEVRTNRELGSGWQVFRQGLSYGLTETDLHIAAVRLPGGRIETFEMVVGPNVSPVVPFPPFSQSVSFRPLPGTLGTLEALGENNVSILDAQPGPVSLRLDSNGDVYNPTLFRYTTPDGTSLDVDIRDGIRRAETPGGQVLTFSASSITHSNGTVVAIERDALGRITRITDPGGFSQDYRYDANGDLRSHSDQEGFLTRFDYDANHNVIGITDPLDRVVVRNEYDDQGRMIRSTNANGDTIHYDHDVSGRRETITDEGGFVTVMDYDDNGNVIRVTDPLGGETTSTYDSRGNRLTFTNAEGETSTFTYDARNNLLTETDSLGAVTRYSYDERDQIASVQDPLGRTTHYEYDALGRQIRVVDRNGNAEVTRIFDGSGSIAASINARGFAIAYERNAQGYVTAILDQRGNRRENQLTPNGYASATVDARGGTSTLDLDRRGLPRSIETPVGTALSYDFDPVRHLDAATDELGNRLRQIRDGDGRLVRVEHPDGSVLTRDYDERGNLIRVVDRAGRETRYEYDALSRRVRTVLPDGGEILATYDGVGRKLSETDPNGNVTTYEYDVAGRNTAVVDALGQRTEFTYDLVGNLVARLDARGNTTAYTHDDLDRLIETRYADGSTETMAYDEVGNVIAETDRLGRTKSYSYDANDNLLTVTDIDGSVTSYAYDENNNRIAQTDANGHTTRMVYDANDRVIEKIYPDGGSERYEYDAGGRIARTVLPDGRFIDATFDGAGRPVARNLNGEATESFAYDGTERLTEATNLWGTVEYDYDADGRVIEIRSEGGHRVSYSYDDLGNRTSISTQLSGQPARTTSYTYDALNRLASVEEPDGDTTIYAYDPVGNVASITYANGVVSSFSYDSVNQLTRIEHRQGATTLAAYDYTLDAGGRRLRVDHANGDSVSYSYDAADRLLQETHRNAANVVIFEETYSYDDVGNRLTRQITGQAQTVLAYDSADKLLSAGSTGFAYDANGRLISRTAPQGTISYAYDVEGQLLRVTTPTGTITYAYDASGKRRLRIENGSEQHFLLDEASLTGYDQTLVAFDENDDQLVEYHWGDRLISADDGSNDRFYHYDASRNTRLLTDEAGAVSDTLDYDAFGNVRNRTGVADSPYGFAGEWQEEAEGLVFLRARFYDPETGRFLSRDPYAGNPYDPVSLHRYLYANANPIMNLDPSGELTLAQKVVVLQVIVAVGIQVTIDIKGGQKSPGRIVVDAIITGTFTAIGGTVGSKFVAPAATKLSGYFAAALADGAKRVMVPLATAFVNASFGAVVSALNLASLDVTEGRNANLTVGNVGAAFAINFFAEAITLGLWEPSITNDAVRWTRQATAREAESRAFDYVMKSGQELWDGFIKSEGDTAIEFLRSIAQEGDEISVALARMEEVLLVEFVPDFVQNVSWAKQAGEEWFVSLIESGKAVAAAVYASVTSP